MWFSVVCTLIDNNVHHHSGQSIVSEQILTTVMISSIDVQVLKYANESSGDVIHSTKF